MQRMAEMAARGQAQAAAVPVAQLFPAARQSLVLAALAAMVLRSSGHGKIQRWGHNEGHCVPASVSSFLTPTNCFYNKMVEIIPMTL